MKRISRFFVVILCNICCWWLISNDVAISAEKPALSSEIRVRPAQWAQPIIGTELENFHVVAHGIYRSGQPSSKDLKTLVEKMGFKSVLCLRDYHDDSDEAEGLALALYRIEMEADEIEPEKIAKALQIINDAPKPLLIHCWHGSDRTGLVCASYRMSVQSWDAKAAVDELINGGFGYHYKLFPGIATWLQSGAIKPGQPFTGKAP